MWPSDILLVLIVCDMCCFALLGFIVRVAVFEGSDIRHKEKWKAKVEVTEVQSGRSDCKPRLEIQNKWNFKANVLPKLVRSAQ